MLHDNVFHSDGRKKIRGLYSVIMTSCFYDFSSDETEYSFNSQCLWQLSKLIMSSNFSFPLNFCVTDVKQQPKAMKTRWVKNMPSLHAEYFFDSWKQKFESKREVESIILIFIKFYDFLSLFRVLFPWGINVDNHLLLSKLKWKSM